MDCEEWSLIAADCRLAAGNCPSNLPVIASLGPPARRVRAVTDALGPPARRVRAKASMVTKIDYADNGIQHFESRLPRTMQFVALNTNVPHVLAESDYAHRVQVIALDDHSVCTASS